MYPTARPKRRRHEQEAAMEQARLRAYDGTEPTWEEARHHLDAALASLRPSRSHPPFLFLPRGQNANSAPKTYRWTKSADEILASITKACARQFSGHMQRT